MSIFNDDEEEPEDSSPYRQVGRINKMPIPAPYDFEQITRWADRGLFHLRSEHQATDETLARGIDLDALERSVKSYNPSDYYVEATREHTGRGSSERARREAESESERTAPA